jgi:PKD repeat protein
VAAPVVSATADTAVQPHTYAGPGSYTVTVVASAGGTSKVAAQSVQVGPPKPSTGYTVGGDASQNPIDGSWQIEAGRPLTVSATEPDPSVTFDWDFGDGAVASGRTASHIYTSVGAKHISLTAAAPTGDTVASGTSVGQISVNVMAPNFKAIMIPGAGSIFSDAGDWATDISITNPDTQSSTVTLYFAAFSDEIPSDLSTLPFDSLNSVPLEAGQSWSAFDVVGTTLNRAGLGKGILFLKFQGATPIVTARVYFTANGVSYGTALPSFVVGPYGATQAQEELTATGQYLIGLRNDPRYRFNVSLFNASSDGGLFHLDAFTEDGEQVFSRDIAVPAYRQFGVNDVTDLFTPDPGKRYVLKATSTMGALQAFASQLDRSNNDLVQVSDDTPQIAAAPDTELHYYISGVGRIESVANNAHWRTDLRFFNPSSLPRNLSLEFHYTPGDSPAEQVAVALVTVGAGKGLSIDDVVGNPEGLNINTDLLPNGTALGLLKVSYSAPPDIATAPLRIGGRIYADLAAGTAGMQLSTYTSAQRAGPGQSLIMPGAQQNLRFRTNVGVFTMGELPTQVLISAVGQDGQTLSSYGWQLNDPGSASSTPTGSFAQIPLTVLSMIDGVHPMAIKVQAIDGSPIGAYIVTVDEISADTVFIQGKNPN